MNYIYYSTESNIVYITKEQNKKDHLITSCNTETDAKVFCSGIIVGNIIKEDLINEIGEFSV